MSLNFKPKIIFIIILKHFPKIILIIPCLRVTRDSFLFLEPITKSYPSLILNYTYYSNVTLIYNYFKLAIFKILLVQGPEVIISFEYFISFPDSVVII